jgi:hypothetical protein
MQMPSLRAVLELHHGVGGGNCLHLALKSQSQRYIRAFLRVDRFPERRARARIVV